MQARCYILFSQKLDKFYVGVTTDDIHERIAKHNESKYGQHRYTSTVDDWVLFLDIVVEDFAHAVRMERKVKAMKSSKYIQNLKKFPELLEKIVIETMSI